MFCRIHQVFSVGFRSLPYQREGENHDFLISHLPPLALLFILSFGHYLTSACIGLTLYKALPTSDLIVLAIMKLPFSRDGAEEHGLLSHTALVLLLVAPLPGDWTSPSITCVHFLPAKMNVISLY